MPCWMRKRVNVGERARGCLLERVSVVNSTSSMFAPPYARVASVIVFGAGLLSK
jgi:hypothetical protein